MTDRISEFIVSDAGGITLSVCPPLPFLPDGVRITPSGVEVYGPSKRLTLRTEPEVIAALRETGGLLLLEHQTEGSVQPRELELLVDE